MDEKIKNYLDQLDDHYKKEMIALVNLLYIMGKDDEYILKFIIKYVEKYK